MVTASNALARLDSAVRGAPGLLRRVLGAAEHTLDETLERLLGEGLNARLARVPMALGGSGVDPFGLDPEWAKFALTTVGLLHRRYFRTEVHGVENVPPGRILLIANHSGQVPLDGAIIGAAMFMDAEPPRIVRAMVEKWAVSLPFVSLLFARVGQVVGVPENAKRLLEQGEALLVFPEGARGISKTFDRRLRHRLTAASRVDSPDQKKYLAFFDTTVCRVSTTTLGSSIETGSPVLAVYKEIRRPEMLSLRRVVTSEMRKPE